MASIRNKERDANGGGVRTPQASTADPQPSPPAAREEEDRADPFYARPGTDIALVKAVVLAKPMATDREVIALVGKRLGIKTLGIGRLKARGELASAESFERGRLSGRAGAVEMVPIKAVAQAPRPQRVGKAVRIKNTITVPDKVAGETEGMKSHSH